MDKLNRNQGLGEGLEEYVLGDTIDVSEVPAWARRPHKWKQIEDAAMDLKPGKANVVYFKDRGVANKMRNTVRENLAERLGKPEFRTEILNTPEEEVAQGKPPFKVLIIRLNPEDIKTEKRK